MKKCLVALGGVVLFSCSFFASSQCCSGWIYGVVEKAQSMDNISGYFNDYALNNMYAQRDYFKSSVYGNLMTEVYSFWGDILVNKETSVMYASFLSNYNKKINILMYASNPSKEQEIFVDLDLYNEMDRIIKYHVDHSDNNDFKAFLGEVKLSLDSLKGKSIAEARNILFPSSGTCTVAQEMAGYC